MKKIICRNCGVVNEFSLEQLQDEGDDWLECALPQGFEWILPAGKITPIMGSPIYISAMGEHLSREAYLSKYDIDPEIAYSLMRGRIGARSASKILSMPHKGKAEFSSAMKSRILHDEDDWTS
ncbi:MAG: hypothetical protein NTW84_00145 [Methanothrix sp.]|jgi:hypothetical protein|nr:hypothetical protein [Methanothrix sp.]